MADNEKSTQQTTTTTTPSAEVKIVAPTSEYVQNSAQGKLETRIPTSKASTTTGTTEKKD